MKTLAILFLAAILADFSYAEEKEFMVGELNQREITGELGIPLHTVEIVECIVVDMSFTRAKADDGRLAFKVVSVGGKVLEEDHYIDIPQELSIDQPKVGMVFRFWGYETVTASGYPTEAFDKLGELPFATEGFEPALKAP